MKTIMMVMMIMIMMTKTKMTMSMTVNKATKMMIIIMHEQHNFAYCYQLLAIQSLKMIIIIFMYIAEFNTLTFWYANNKACYFV